MLLLYYYYTVYLFIYTHTVGLRVDLNMKTLTTLKILKMILTSMLMTAILKTQALSVKDLKRKIRLPALAAAADVVDGMMTWRKHSYVNVCIVAVLGLKCWSCLLKTETRQLQKT